MIRVQLLDGEIFEGDTYDDVVAQMAAEKFEAPRSLETYRKATASRCEDMYGVEVETENNEVFINSLIQAELARPI